MVKGRGCPNGKQQETMDTAEILFPTVAIESVLLTSTLDALEKRAVYITDIPGVYLNAEMNELVHTRLKG